VSQVPRELAGHVVITGADGELLTPPEDLDRAVRALATHERVVLHFHGGLVSEEAGLRTAAELAPVYTDAGAYPLFFIWHSDAVSVLRGNLMEISKEEIFQRLLKKVLGFAAAKLGADPTGAKGLGLSPVQPHELDVELGRLAKGEVPFDDIAADDDAPGDEPVLTPDELADFADDVERDDELQAHVDAAVQAADPDAPEVRAKGVVIQVRASEHSLLDPEAIAELQARRPGEPVARGLGITTAFLVKKAVKVLVAIIRRRRDGRWHGLYATAVEEVLREFYLANVGAVIWAAMKTETRDTFVAGARPRGGERFLTALGRELDAGAQPRFTLVGHSTGAVFIINLLRTIDVARLSGDGGLPEAFQAENVVFLAPACTFDDFAEVVERREHLWRRFVMFTMTDQAERADRVFSFIYPHSLLYLVSGLFERDAGGKSEGAKPLVGLQRWCRGEQTAPAALPIVRALLRADDELAIVWSPTDGAPGPSGLTSGATSHGAFDNDAQVKDSLKRVIAGG
jgi:hypothetical protein